MPSTKNPHVWQAICPRAPCLVRVQIGGEYRVSGPGIASSRTFKVYPNAGALALYARTRSNTARDVGYLAIATGAVATLVGGFWATAYATCLACTEEEKDRGATPGLAVMLGGLVAVGVGIAMAVANGTHLEFGTAYVLRQPPVPAMDVR